MATPEGANGASSATGAGRPAVSTPTGLERTLLWSAVIVMLVLGLWLSTTRTWNLDRSLAGEEFNATYFREQAVSMLHGRFDVPGGGYTWTECFDVDGKCFGYFGITPSLLRIPVIAVAGSDAPNLTPVFIALAIGLTMWAVLDLFLRLLARLVPDDDERRLPGLLAILATALLLGPGSLLTFLARPRIYHEAILWMIAFLLVAMNFVYRWIVGRRRIDLVVALLAATASTGARPSSIPSAIALGLGIAVILVLDRRRTPPSPSEVALTAGLTTVPAATASGVLWAKFGIVGIPWRNYSLYRYEWMQRIVRSNDGVLQGARFIPTNLLNYLRPDSVRFTWSRPWFVEQVPRPEPAIAVWPVVQSGILVEPVASLTNMMAGPLLLTVGVVIGAILRLVRMDRDERRAFVVLLVSAAMCTVAVITTFAISTRYESDAYPLLAVGTVFAVAHATRWLRGRRRALIGAFIATMIVGLVSFQIQLQLTTT